MRNKKLAHIEIGELTFEECGCKNPIPALQIKVVDNETNEMVSEGFMTPFRGYRFQISCDKKGNGDCGSSPASAIRLQWMAKNDDLDGLQTQMITALAWFTSYRTGTCNFEYITVFDPFKVLMNSKEFIRTSAVWLRTMG